MAFKGKAKFSQTVVKKTRVATTTTVAPPMNRVLDAIKLPNVMMEPLPKLPSTLLMGFEFDKPPFAYPKCDEHQEFINKILSYSLKLQKGDDIPFSSGFILGIVSQCLQAKNVHVEVQRGIRKLGKKAKPHMWLLVNGVIIDNIFRKTMTKAKVTILEDTYPDCYEEEEFVYPLQDVISTSSDEAVTKEAKLDEKKRWIEFFINEPDMAMALSLNHEQTSNMFFKFTRYLWENYEITIRGIDPGVRYCCWYCKKFPNTSSQILGAIITAGECETTQTSSKHHWRFQQCNNCMAANYCSVACQKQDWKRWHCTCCMSRASVYISPSTNDDVQMAFVDLKKGDRVTVN